MVKKKASSVLLTPEDEVALQGLITVAHPDVRIINSGPWQDADTPPVLESITDARFIGFIWPTSLRPTLTTEVRSDGTVWGVHTYEAVQWELTRLKDGTLDAGSFSAVIEPDMEAFVRSVWRILFRFTTNDLVRLHQPTGEYVREPTYRVGPHALSEARAGRLTLLDIRLVLYPPPE